MKSKSKAQPEEKSELRRALDSVRGAFAAVGVFSFFINMLMLLPAIYMLQIYDRVMSSRSMETLAMITIIILVMFVVMGLLQILRSRILVRVSVRLDRQLSGRVFDSMLRESLVRPGSDSAQAMSDANTLRQFLTGPGLLAFFDAPWVPVYLAVMFAFHFWLGMYGVAALVILTALAVVNELITRKPLAAANQSEVEARRFASENVRNAEVIHAMGMSPQICERLDGYEKRTLGHQSFASDRAGIFSNLSRTFRLAVQALAYGVGAILAIQGHVSAGGIVAGAILIGQALRPVDQLIGAWGQVGGALAAYRRLQRVLSEHPARERAMSLPTPSGKWSFEAVSAAPPGQRMPTVRNISIAVEPGEALGLIGPSGSGKTTLARAGLGVWPILGGAVRLDGAEIGHYNRDELGPSIGYLPQDIELFNGTVAENIARFGEPDPQAVVVAAQRAGADAMIRLLPDGYDTHVGSAGGVLSAGQRQRVGLARAVYGLPQLIVLDEPNSNLDDDGERALLELIAFLREQGCAAMLITHKRQLLAMVDKLAVIQNGALSLYGPRDQVLARLSGKADGGAKSGASAAAAAPAAQTNPSSA